MLIARDDSETVIAQKQLREALAIRNKYKTSYVFEGGSIPAAASSISTKDLNAHRTNVFT